MPRRLGLLGLGREAGPGLHGGGSGRACDHEALACLVGSQAVRIFGGGGSPGNSCGKHMAVQISWNDLIPQRKYKQILVSTMVLKDCRICPSTVYSCSEFMAF